MLTALILVLLSAAPADALRAGAAAVDITPAVGTPMAGYYAERLAQGVHDPLYAKAYVDREWSRDAVTQRYEWLFTYAVDTVEI